MNRITSALALVVAAALVGCAAPKLPKQAFNAAAATQIKNVVLTQSQNQQEYEAVMLGHPGASFGLIGGLIAAADTSSKSKKLTVALDPAETRLQERFAARLRERLMAGGYGVQVVTMNPGIKDDAMLAAARSGQDADAFVVVSLTGAYFAAGPNSDYFPRMIARVKTVDRAGATLYEDTISYGYATPDAKSVHLASDPQYRFDSINTLVLDPAKTRQGLLEGVEAITAQIATDLHKQ
jgi:ABC-type glycerol-3-phosphate transport system substrate-binding protein